MLNKKKRQVFLAVKNEDELEKAIKLNVEIIFVLFGSIMNIKKTSEKISKSGIIGFVHIDLIEGLSKEDASVDFIKNNTSFKGIISTKKKILKKSKEVGLYTILRTFIIDSRSKENIINSSKKGGNFFDALEILPGTIFNTLEEIKNKVDKPLIAGGLIQTKEEVEKCFNTGVDFISTSNFELLIEIEKGKTRKM